MKRNSFASFIAVMLMLVMSVAAYAADPVTWMASSQMTGDNEGVVTLTATIEPGWHLYGTTMPADGPSATKLYYGATGAVFTSNVKASPKPISKFDDMFGINLTYWENKVSFTRKFKLAEGKSTAKIKIKVNFMCCNDANCRPPKTMEFNVDVK